MDKNKNTILIVDDEPQIRKMLNIYLDASDFYVEEAENGKQAIRLAVSLKPDLILLDLGLPDIDGKEVIANIRSWSQVPIIVLSVRSLDEEIVTALDAGANDYVLKPISASCVANCLPNPSVAPVTIAQGPYFFKNFDLFIIFLSLFLGLNHSSHLFQK